MSKVKSICCHRRTEWETFIKTVGQIGSVFERIAEQCGLGTRSSVVRYLMPPQHFLLGFLVLGFFFFGFFFTKKQPSLIAFNKK